MDVGQAADLTGYFRGFFPLVISVIALRRHITANRSDITVALASCLSEKDIFGIVSNLLVVRLNL